MSGWGGYLAAWGFFLATHSLPVRPPLRPWLVERLGGAGFALAYSALSVAALGWLIVAAGRAPYVLLWPQPWWGQWAVLIATGAAGLILALALGRPNPFSFGGSGNDRFDPDRPGILRHMRHPILVAVLLWAGGHLIVNGDLAHVLLFGGFAGFALVGMTILDRRRRREMGAEGWAVLWARTRQAPAGAGYHRPVLRGLAALAGVAGLMALHPWLAGVAILQHFLP